MADQVQAKGIFNYKLPDGRWKYVHRKGVNGDTLTKHWDSTNKKTSDITQTGSTKTDTTKPINNEQGRLKIKNMLESKIKNK